MTKSTTTMTLDEGLIKSLKARNLNVSRIVNDFLTQFLEISPEELKLKEMEKEILKTEARLVLLRENKAKMELLNKKKEEEKGLIFHFKGEENAD